MSSAANERPNADRSVDMPADALGVWIRAWDLAIALAALVGAFALVRINVVQELLSTAVSKEYFSRVQLLLDQHRHGYSFETVKAHLYALGDEGRAIYAHSFLPIYDVALSVFLLTFSVLLVLYATQQDRYYAMSLPPWLRRFLVFPPVLQFLFDVGENVALRQVLSEYPRIHPRVVEAASQFTQLKWLMIYLNAMIIISLSVFTVYRWCSPAARRSR